MYCIYRKQPNYLLFGNHRILPAFSLQCQLVSRFPGLNMAPLPQQNSTFIDDNLDTCPMLLNLPESPILPTKHQHGQRVQNQEDNNNKATNSQNQQQHMDSNNNNKNKNMAKAKANGNGQQSRRQRHRSISLYGVNSTMVSASHVTHPPPSLPGQGRRRIE